MCCAVGAVLTAVVLGRGGGLGVVHVALTPLVGWSFGLAGLVACLRQRWRQVGGLMIMVALAWFVHLLDWTHVPAVVAAAAPFRNAYAAVFAHLLLAFPAGRVRSRGAWVLVAAGYLDAVGVQFVASVVAGGDRSAAVIWYDVEAAVGVVLAGLVIAVLIRRARHASAGERRPTLVVWCAASVACVALAGNLLSSWLAPRFELALWVLFSALFAAVPFGFLASLLGVRLRRAGVAGLVVRLGRVAGPAELRAALTDTLRDPSLEVVYWMPERQGYLDLQGRPVELPGESDRRVASMVERDGRRIAALIHDRALRHEPELVDAAGAAAALALDNARLHTELRARLTELTASRARLVEVGAAERRRIERDLHDGAQQQLVSVAFALGVAQSRLSGASTAARDALAEARTGLAAALDQLRRLSQGIHPGVLVERGLRAGVAEVAWASPVPVAVEWHSSDRLPEAVELAGYYVVAEALTNVAKHARAGSARVRVTEQNGRVEIEIVDDGVGGADVAGGSGLRGLADRVEALGGTLTMASASGRGTTIRVELPCG